MCIIRTRYPVLDLFTAYNLCITTNYLVPLVPTLRGLTSTDYDDYDLF